MADNMRLSLVLSAKDRMSSIIKSSTKKSDKAFAEFEKRLEKTSSVLSGIGKKSMLAGGAMIGASVLNLKAAADFETSMTNVSTLIDTNVESIDAMGQKVLEIGSRTPVALSDLSGALYDVRSAGIVASDQFNVLEKSAQLGVAGLGSTKEAVDLVTSSINSFNLKGEEQNKLYDNIFKTVKTGKTNISGLAQGFGSVAGTVAAAGIKIDDYLASVAALTTTGAPASQAHTQMKAAIAGLTRNTEAQQKVFKSLNAKDFNDLIKKSGGVVGAFSGINKSVGGNKAKMIELLGSIEAYNAVLSLTGNQNQAYTDTLNDMRNGANEFDKAYDKQSGTINAQLQRGKNLLEKVSIDFGNYIAPAFGTVLDVATKVMKKIEGMPEPLKKFIAVSTLAGGAALVGFGTIMLGASGAVNAIKDVTKTYKFLSEFMNNNKFTPGVKSINSLGWAFKGLGLSIAATPIGWVIAGIAGLAVAGLVIYKYWKPLKAFFGGFASGLKKSLKPAFDEIKTALKPLSPVIDKVVKVTKSFRDWVGKLIKPVNTLGEKSRSWGEATGMLIGNIVKGVFAFGKFLFKLTPIGAVTYQIYKNFDKITAAVGFASEKIKGFFSKFGKGKNIDINATVKGEAGKKVDGGHKNGLASVPFDGYVAELHKGERVLTAQQNRQLTRGVSRGNVIYLTYNPVINAEKIRDTKDLEVMLERHDRKLIEKLRNEQRRREARQYG